jgi:hypothetical protein
LRDFGHVSLRPQPRGSRVEAGEIGGGHRGDLRGDAVGDGAQGVDGGAPGERFGKALGRRFAGGLRQRGLRDQGIVVGLAGEAGQGKDAAFGLGVERAEACARSIRPGATGAPARAVRAPAMIWRPRSARPSARHGAGAACAPHPRARPCGGVKKPPRAAL